MIELLFAAGVAMFFVPLVLSLVFMSTPLLDRYGPQRLRAATAFLFAIGFALIFGALVLNTPA